MHANRLPTIATIALGALAVAMAVIAALKTYALFQPVAIDMAPTSSEREARPRADSVDLNILLTNPLFGTAPVASTTAPENTEVRDTRLRITLLGVVAGDNGSGVAVLSHDGKIRSYSVGQRLDMRQKVTLHSVYPDHVLIDYRGARERIALKGTPSKRSSNRSASTAVRKTANNSQQVVTTRSVNLKAPAIRSLVGDARETITNSPLKLVRFMTAQPWDEGSKRGYRIQSGIDKRLLPYLGLKSGDVVLAVNDRPVRSINIGEVNNLVNGSDRFALRVLRDGQEIGINLDL